MLNPFFFELSEIGDLRKIFTQVQSVKNVPYFYFFNERSHIDIKIKI
jgi:hypothetical protein